MTRCPSCGRRVTTVCPVHGKFELPGVEPDSSQISGPTSPTFEGYRILRLVARGGFGSVFEAESEHGGRVAIKLPRPDRPDARLCLSHEVRVLEDVGPPHVPAVLGYGELGDGTPFLVMEYLTTPTLADRLLARAEPMPPEEACTLTLSILDALAVVHARGYVHCDLKPENIFFSDADRHVTLVDFGLVAAVELAGRSRESTTGAGVGTAEYMSPEQCEGRPDIDTRADLYAIGVILFELCAGHPPFWGARTVVRESHLSRRPPRLSTSVPGRPVPRVLDDLVARCLAKDRRDRYAGVPELQAALAVALEEAVTAARAFPSPQRPAERPTMRSPAGQSPGAPARADRVPVGLLFFSTRADVVAVQAQITPLGGHLAHAAGGRYVAAFGQETGDNPARRALRAAEELLRQGLASRVRLDLAPVAVQSRKDGSKRYMSPLFTRAERFPPDSGPAGLSLTPDAAAVLPDAGAPGEGASEPPARASGTTPRMGIELPSMRLAAPSVPRIEADPTAEMAGWPMVGRDAVLDALVASARRAAGEAVPAAASVIGEPGQGKSHLFRVLVKRLTETGVAEVLALRAREPALGDADHTLAELLQRTLDLPALAPPDGGRELLRERLGQASSQRTHASDGARPRGQSTHPGRDGGPQTFAVRETTKPPATVRDAPSSVVPTAGNGSPTLRPPPTFAPPSATPASIPESRAPASGADLGPAVALALGWVVPGAPDSAMRPELKALGAAPGALRSALTVAAGEALRKRAATRPLFVVIDDAHYGSDVLISALEYAALSESGARLWICALGRPAFEQQAPSWGERAGRREVHRLGPLDPPSAATLCRRLLLPVESVADSAVQRLVDRAQAIPLLLVELVRGLRREGIVRRSPKGEAWYLATDELDRLPDLPLIEWLARSELDALAPTLRGHARLLALLGEQVTHADVAGLLLRLEQEGGDLEFPLDGRVATQRLLAASIVVEDRDGRIGFRHALVRETIARGTPEALRRRIHHAAALHYLDAGDHDRHDGRRDTQPPSDRPTGGADEHRLAKLAYHAGEAGMGAVAERAYFDLAQRARLRHAYTDAERLYSRALEQRGEAGPAERAAAYRGRGLMRYRIGRYHDSLTDFSCARTMIQEQGDVAAQIDILLDEATAFDWMDDYTSSEARVDEAEALLPEARTPLLEARVLLGVGRAAHRFSRNEIAAALMEQAERAAEPLGEEGYETLVIALTLLGFIYPGLGRLDDALSALDRTIAICESHGDRLHLTGAINTRALVWGCLGDKEQMIADMERGLASARALGHSTLELVGEYNCGEFLLLMDDPDAAEPHVRRALDINRKLSGDPGRPVVALLEARLRLYRGDVAGARAIAARIRERAAELRRHDEPDTLMAPSEDVICAMVELATTDAGPEAWDALEARSERFSVGQERIEVIETRALAAYNGGRMQEARGHYNRALALTAYIPNAIGARIRRRIGELS
jgi:tetratricopeptide (TPR) repeat protein